MKRLLWAVMLAATAAFLAYAQTSDKQAAALDKFLKLAAAAQIPERSITKALFEGRLNLPFEELEDAYAGLGQMPPEQVPRKFIDDLIRTGI